MQANVLESSSYDISSSQTKSNKSSNTQTAQQWLDENREAIKQYNRTQAEKGKTFSEIVRQL